MWAVGVRVGGAVRVARLADNQIGDSGMTALAAALPQMPSLTTLDLSGTAMPARCGFLLGAFASVVRRQLALSSLACRPHGRVRAAGLRVGGAVRASRLAES